MIREPFSAKLDLEIESDSLLNPLRVEGGVIERTRDDESVETTLRFSGLKAFGD